MAFAAGEDDVARLGEAHGEADGLPSVGDAIESFPLHSALVPCAESHHFQNVAERFGARVFGGKHGDVCKLDRGFRHQPPLLHVAQTGRAEDGDHSAKT